VSFDGSDAVLEAGSGMGGYYIAAQFVAEITVGMFQGVDSLEHLLVEPPLGPLDPPPAHG